MADEEVKEQGNEEAVDDGGFDAMFNASVEGQSSEESQVQGQSEEVFASPEQKVDEKPVVEDEKQDPLQSLMDKISSLEARLAEREKPESKSEEQKQAIQDQEIPDDIKMLYEDFPAFQKAAQWEAQRMLDQKLSEKFGDVNFGELVAEMNLERFKNDVVNGFYDETGAFVEGVPDAVKITNDPEYWKWFESKGYQPGDQKVAVKVLNQYKAELAAKASAQKQEQNRAKGQKLHDAYSETISSGNRGGAGVSGSPKADDFEGAFEEAVSTH
jgi:hypothetical protein